MTTTRSLNGLALAGARAGWAGSVGTGLVLGLAATLVSLTGVLAESGLRAAEGGPLLTVASSFAGTGLLLVVLVVSATTTLALRRRRREFALLRAVGATRGQVRRLVVTELVALGAVCAPLGAVPGLLLARLLDPALRDAGVVGPTHTAHLSPWPVLAAVALVVPTALVAGLFAARETVAVPPTAAVRDSAAEARPVGTARRVSALVLALLGLAAAGTPLLVPGTVGAASAGTSAFLLVGAAALAGPVLVAWVLGRAGRLTGHGTAPTRLAVANLAGFSRRLTGVVVPLALVVAVGTTQSTVDRAVQRAATEQLTAAIGTPWVAAPAGGLSEADLADLAAAPGVSDVVPLGDVAAQVRTDDDAELPDSLRWETARVRVVPPDVERSQLDPGVTEGALSALSESGTVAISSDLAFETSTDLGDRLGVRLDGHEDDLRVVAVYERGLGLGPVVVGPATAADGGAAVTVSTALVDAGSGGAAPDGTTSANSYVAAATSPEAASQHLSSLLTLLLLGFVVLGALNALVLLTAGRRDELRLLHRTGATARQLLAMAGVEAGVTGLVAWALGTLAVVPAVLGITGGLLGLAAPALDLTTYLALSGTVLVVAVGATLVPAVPTVRAATRVAR